MAADVVELFYVALPLAVLHALGMHSGNLHVLSTVCSRVYWLVVLGRVLLLVITVIIGGILMMRHQSWSIRKYLSLSFLDVADRSILTFWSCRIIIDKGRIDGPKLSISLHLNSLIPQDNPALPFRSLQINVLGIMNNLPKYSHSYLSTGTYSYRLTFLSTGTISIFFSGTISL
jgi:hypothetical protein